MLNCTTDAQGQRHCTSETVQRAEQAEALRDRFMKESQEQQAEIGRLQGELQAVPAVRPGRELLAALPDGHGGEELALLSAIALLIGAGCGLLGPASRRGKLLAGAGSAFLALLVFLGLTALLPDTRRTDLLLALAGAALTSALFALLRQIVLRRREQPAAAAGTLPS